MTMAADLDTDDDLTDDPAEPKPGEQRSAAYWERQTKAREKELAAERDKVATFERRDALDSARRDLKAEGPIGAFLTIYDGEPTPEAIREAASKHPEFKDLITFPEDPRDTAARVQNAGAAKVKGADPVATRSLEDNTAPGTPRLENAYAKGAGTKT